MSKRGAKKVLRISTDGGKSYTTVKPLDTDAMLSVYAPHPLDGLRHCIRCCSVVQDCEGTRYACQCGAFRW